MNATPTWGNVSREVYHFGLWFVYILHGECGIYIGISSNPENRIIAHRVGDEFSQHIGNFYVSKVFCVGYDFIVASKFERWLKRQQNPESCIVIENIVYAMQTMKDTELESRVKYIRGLVTPHEQQ